MESGSMYKPVSGGKRRRKLTSEVWSFFTFVAPDKNGKLQCKCNKCGQFYNAESKYGTGNLQRHVKKCKKTHIVNNGCVKLFRINKGSYPVNKASAIPGSRDGGGNGKGVKLQNDVEKTCTIDSDHLVLQNDGVCELGIRPSSVRFNSEIFREMIAMAIVQHDLPLQFVEYEGVRRAFSYLKPGLEVLSRNATECDVIRVFRREKEKIKDLLQSVPGRIALSCDSWDCINTDGYVSITAHFVDKDWNLRKKILNFSGFPPPYTGAALTERILGLLDDWGIKKKVMAITLDNVCADELSVGLLKDELGLLSDGEFLHNCCCAHFLNLIVQEGLKVVDVVVDKIRESIKYCKEPLARNQKFLDCVSMASLDSTKGLRQDVPTRWNSTYLMLRNALYYRKAFEHLQSSDSGYVHCPSPEEWYKIEKLQSFLRVLYEVTCAVSGTKYPTANLYFTNVVRVRMLLKQEMERMESNDNSLKLMATKMYPEFEKYWANFSSFMAIAVILDPRYKLHVVDWAFSKIYGAAYSVELALLKGKLFSLFEEYKLLYPSLASKETSIPHNTTNATISGSDFMEDFDSFSSQVFVVPAKSELELYLGEEKFPRTSEIDILAYWKNCQAQYPILSQMARDILAVPLSTVASEAAFNIGGRVLDKFKSSMEPRTVEAVICLRDWMFDQEVFEQLEFNELCDDITNLKVDADEFSSSSNVASGSGSGSGSGAVSGTWQTQPSVVI